MTYKKARSTTLCSNNIKIEKRIMCCVFEMVKLKEKVSFIRSTGRESAATRSSINENSEVNLDSLNSYGLLRNWK